MDTGEDWVEIEVLLEQVWLILAVSELRQELKKM
jgi:hypothetical protein